MSRKSQMNGHSEDTFALRNEVSRLKESLKVKEGELQSATSKLGKVEAELKDRQGRLEQLKKQGKEQNGDAAAGADSVKEDVSSKEQERQAEIQKLSSELASTRRRFEESQKEVQGLRRELDAHETSSAKHEEEVRRLNREVLSTSNENRQLRLKVEELSKDKAEFLEKAKKNDARLMHAAAEAELTCMGHREPTAGWGSGSVAVVAVVAAVGGGLLISALKQKA